MQFRHDQLDNGLTLLAEVNPSAATMAVGLFVNTGARDETPREAGMSHFLEHMVFKGTPRRSAADVNREFDDMGANYNAFTSEESTVYYASVLPEFQDRVTDLLCDILRPSLREDDFTVEQQVILEEIALYEDQPSYRVYEKLMGEFFEGHGLANPVLGTNESISAMTPADMRDYFDRRYAPGNVLAVAVGNVDYDRFRRFVTDRCGTWQSRVAERRLLPAPGHVRQTVITDPRVLREHLGFMSPAPAAQGNDDYAAQLAATVLGDDSGSRLYYALIDPALADEANTTYSAMDRTGAFYTFVSTDPERTSEVIGIVRDELLRFRDEGPTEAELLAAKNKIASGATLKGEIPMGRLTAVGFDWAYRGEYVPLPEQIDRMFAVTREQVTEVVRRYDLTAAAVLGLGPCETL